MFKLSIVKQNIYIPISIFDIKKIKWNVYLSYNNNFIKDFKTFELLQLFK